MKKPTTVTFTMKMSVEAETPGARRRIVRELKEMILGLAIGGSCEDGFSSAKVRSLREQCKKK